MAQLDFGLLTQAPTIGSRFIEGQQAAQQQVEQNRLRQMQMMQMEAQRENLLAQREQRTQQAAQLQAAQEQAQRRQGFITQATDALAQGNEKFDRPTLLKVLQSGLQAQEPTLVKFAQEGIKALDEEEGYQREMARLFGGAAPAAPGQSPAPAASGQAPAPGAAPTNAMSAGRPTPEMISNMLMSSNPNVRKMGESLRPLVPPIRASQLLTPEEEAQRARIALAGRPPAQPREPAAPTITQIQNPADPSQMITIDARRYQGGGVGSPGVIGTSGKTAPVAAAEQKRTEGAQQAKDILDTLRTAYDELDRMRAVPSEQRSTLSNATAWIASTGVGQTAGRVAGTKEQTQRDIIASARNQMLNAIKNATGMSAQQLNSNVEFRSWLEALTDPTRSIEANLAILDNMEQFIASGGKYSAKKEKPAAGGGVDTSNPLLR